MLLESSGRALRLKENSTGLKLIRSLPPDFTRRLFGDIGLHWNFESPPNSIAGEGVRNPRIRSREVSIDFTLPSWLHEKPFWPSPQEQFVLARQTSLHLVKPSVQNQQLPPPRHSHTKLSIGESTLSQPQIPRHHGQLKQLFPTSSTRPLPPRPYRRNAIS